MKRQTSVAECALWWASMIDWLTMRYPLDKMPSALIVRLRESMLYLSCCSIDQATGEISTRWEKQSLDLDKLRSDTPGLFWQMHVLLRSFLHLDYSRQADLSQHGHSRQRLHQSPVKHLFRLCQNCFPHSVRPYAAGLLAFSFGSSRQNGKHGNNDQQKNKRFQHVHFLPA